MLSDLPDEALAVGLGHRVARLDAAVGVDERLEARSDVSGRDGGLVVDLFAMHACILSHL